VKHIIGKESSLIKPGYQIISYDILLKLLKGDKDFANNAESNVNSVEIKIHLYKADQITKLYLGNKSKVA